MAIPLNMIHFSDISAIELDQVIKLVKDLYGYDFSSYARASFMRRVNKFMKDNGIDTAVRLIVHLSAPDAFLGFLQTITVNVTEIFRDPEAYSIMRNKILPALGSYPNIKIWHAGCSTGEEVYSMCILLHEAGLLSRSTIYATDINASNIEKAKAGMVPLAKMKEYTGNYLRAGGTKEFSDYYTARYDHALIRSDLRKQVVFFQHNLVTDQAFNEFHLIMCRNVMIYFDRQLQNRILQLFYDSMPALGFLSLGMKETIAFSPLSGMFDAVDPGTKLFKKNVR